MNGYMILGGQFGSEGKGLLAYHLACERKPDAVICAYAPSAGHTAWVDDQPLVFKCLPVGSVAPSVTRIMIGPGAVVDPELMAAELARFGPLLTGKQIIVHENVSVLRSEDAATEREGLKTIASTMQGGSEAMIRKIRRRERPEARAKLGLMAHVVGNNHFNSILYKHVRTLQIEGCQGMDLGLNTGLEYPYVTSRDCGPSQVLADCGLHPEDLNFIYVVLRTMPIRVGNLHNPDGTLIGSSGPVWNDQKELTWNEVGQVEELTTVTKRVRRIFTFSWQQYDKMIRDFRPSAVMLNFANYLPSEQVEVMVKEMNRRAKKNVVKWIGNGPKSSDIVTLKYPTQPLQEYGE